MQEIEDQIETLWMRRGGVLFWKQAKQHVDDGWPTAEDIIDEVRVLTADEVD